MAIVRAKAPRSPERLTGELVAFVQRLRKQDLFKSPGVAETLDWAAALTELDAVALDPAQVSDTLGVLLKYQDDIAKIEGAKAQTLIEETRAELVILSLPRRVIAPIFPTRLISSCFRWLRTAPPRHFGTRILSTSCATPKKCCAIGNKSFARLATN